MMTIGVAPAPTIGRAFSGLALRPTEVHVWRRSLDLDGGLVAGLVTVLSPDERLRAARFHFERDAVRFVVARATLRGVLGAYLGVAPAQVVFRYGAHGKPVLAWPAAPLTFNVSHSADLALYAIAVGRQVGVDVEQPRRVDDLDGLAAQVFAAPERAELASLPTTERVAGFFNGWTRKEAFIKAVGEGLSHPLDTFVVSLDPRAPARLVSVGGRPGPASGWSLHALAAAPGYTAALVAEGDVSAPTCRTWAE